MLNELKKIFEGKEFTLIKLDDKAIDVLNLSNNYSIFEDGSYMNCLYDLNVVYITDLLENTGYKFNFEISKNDEVYPSNIVLKITDVEEF